MINEWKKGVEGKWTSVQEEWSVEKDRLRRARDEWELKTKTIEDGILARVESRLSVIQQRDGHPFMNGSAKPNGQGLVTPPSPRSLSSDSMRPRSRKKRNGSSRGRTKSPSQSPRLQPTPTPMKTRNLPGLEQWFRDFSQVTTAFSLDNGRVK
jgi:hypothetical protein